MRRAKGWTIHGSFDESAREGMNGRDFDRLGFREIRKYRSGGTGKHRFARPGWAVERDIVSSRNSDHKSAFRAFLPSNVVERGIFFFMQRTFLRNICRVGAFFKHENGVL